MKEAILLLRLAPEPSIRLASNPALQERYDFVWIGQWSPEPYLSAGCFRAAFQDFPLAGDPNDRTRNLLLGALRGFDVKHVLLVGALLPYAKIAAEACGELGVDLIYVEGGTRLLSFDRIGCQYTKDNEIRRYADRLDLGQPLPLPETKVRQPGEEPPGDLRSRLGIEAGRKAVVVFGQVEGDSAILPQGGLPIYGEWLDALFRKNDDTTFLFKHHPYGRTRGLERYRNVVEVDGSIHSFFSAFDAFAAYSSTTILEGAFAGRAFLTGGHHFLDDPRLSLVIRDPGRTGGAYDAIRGFRADPDLLRRRLAFITRKYLLDPGAPEVARRLRTTSTEYHMG